MTSSPLESHLYNHTTRRKSCTARKRRQPVVADEAKERSKRLVVARVFTLYFNNLLDYRARSIAPSRRRVERKRREREESPIYLSGASRRQTARANRANWQTASAGARAQSGGAITDFA